eukprot:278174_1
MIFKQGEKNNFLMKLSPNLKVSWKQCWYITWIGLIIWFISLALLIAIHLKMSDSAHLIRNASNKGIHPTKSIELIDKLLINTYTNISKTNGIKMCDILIVKGLPKTGTTWIEVVLTIIKETLCDMLNNEYNNNIDYYLCNINNTVQWKDKHFIWINNENYPYSKSTRVCNIISFRDPRDRTLSWLYFHYLTEDRLSPNDFNKHFMNQKYRVIFKDCLLDTNIWWEEYKKRMIDNPYEYFVYFYEDLNGNKSIAIEQVLIPMITYIIGDNMHLLTQLDMDYYEHIYDKITFEYLSKVNKYDTRRRKGKVCDYDSELWSSVIDWTNYIMRLNMHYELLEKFNTFCDIHQLNLSQLMPKNVIFKPKKCNRMNLLTGHQERFC